MKRYPRNAKSRADALAGSGHIGNHGPADHLLAQDRLKRFYPSTDLTKVLPAYGGHTGAAPYVAKAVHFDGMAALTRSSLIGVVDSPLASFSLWVKIATNTVAQGNPELLNADTDTFKCLIGCEQNGDNTNSIEFLGNTPDASSEMYASSPVSGSDTFDLNVWMWFAGSLDTSTNGDTNICSLVKNAINVCTAFPFGTGFDIPFAGKAFGFPDNIANGPLIVADFADVWWAPGQYLDFTNPAVQAKFYNAGKPVFLGANGELPTGTPPAAFMSGDHTTFPTNQGTGGAFTLTGALTDATTSP